MVPCPFVGEGGIPVRAGGGTPVPSGGTPVPGWDTPARTDWDIPPARTGWGTLLLARTGWGTPLPP